MTTRSAPSQAAVLGHPIDHSLSPVLHQAAYRALGLAIEYTRADVDLDQVETFYRDRRHELTTGHTRWLGFSVTMPLKPALVPLMDQLSDRVRRLGVLNTVVLDASGQATGYNTDCDGIVRALMRAETPASSTLGIIGGGGTAAAAIEAAQLMGVTGVELLVRNQAKTEPQRKLATDLGLAAEIDSIASGLTKLDRYRYVISTLPPGAASEFAHSLSGYTWLPPLLDVAYDPGLPAGPRLASQWWTGDLRYGDVTLPSRRTSQAVDRRAPCRTRGKTSYQIPPGRTRLGCGHCGHGRSDRFNTTTAERLEGDLGW